jgi:hypothetical protein
MKAFSFVLLAAAASQLAVHGASAASLSDDVIGELQQMKSVYTAEYAPADWKRKYAGYDLQTEFDKAVAAVKANPNLTQRDAREIFKNFIYAMKDYHTSISFVGTEASSLPFIVQGTDTRFFIMYIDRAKLPETAFPFHVGDELVTFDGKPTAQAVADVQSQIPGNVPTTDKAIAEMRLTHRSAANGLDVPHGPITIGVRPQGAAADASGVVNFQMAWDYTPEQVQPRTTPSSHLAFELGNRGSIFHPIMNRVDGDASPTATPYDLGARRTFTPLLGTPIWQSADSDIFYAYEYKSADGKLIGYLRLPSYEADDFGKAVAEFARDVTLFEATTDGMVIDEANNPGGSVFYLYALASMLAKDPLTTPLHKMSITQADVAQAATQIPQLEAVKTDADAQKLLPGADTDGYPVTYEFAQFTLAYDQFIVNQWNAGHQLTEPFWIGGVDHINAAPTHYTKPILLLINHLDFSGGDFFPAIMQDNKRVTVMGGRTAGAGGYVNDISIPNDVGVNAFRCTESIAWRVDQNPIENLGVTPDVPYEMTAEDFTNNYAPYVKAVQAELSSLTK